MRLTVGASLVLLPLAALGCDGGPLTGPEAGAAYAEAAGTVAVVPHGWFVFVDDRRLAAGERLDQLDPTTIERIEVLKGPAAARLYGDAARAGVIRIYTTPSAASVSASQYQPPVDSTTRPMRPGEFGAVPLQPERRTGDPRLFDARSGGAIGCDQAEGLVLVDAGVPHGSALLG